MKEGVVVSKAKKEEKKGARKDEQKFFWCSKEVKGNGFWGGARVMLRERKGYCSPFQLLVFILFTLP